MVLRIRFCTVLLTVLLTVPFVSAPAADQPQWGQRHSRNMVSDETRLPARFDPESGRNVKWRIDLGTQVWSTPVVAGGCILIGTNNDRPRDPRITGDRGVLLCLDEKDGGLKWQLVTHKFTDSVYKDWPRVGMVSPPTVEGDRVYMLTNRNEVVCLDLDGQADGNDGPFTAEGQYLADEGEPPLDVAGTDADILWLYPIAKELGIFPHDSAHASILIDGDFLYVNTNSGLNDKHSGVRVPQQPSLIVLDKGTGRLVAQEAEGIGPRIFHSTWSSPARGPVGGAQQVVFCGGDGIVYGFEPVRETADDGDVAKLNCLWRFDPDPAAPKENVHEYIRNREVSPSNIKSMPVLVDGRVYITHGGDIWWGKRQSWLKCINPNDGTGDITEDGLVWSYELREHCCSTPAVHEGLVYAADCGKMMHCVDAQTGRPCWTHELDGDVWGSPMVADGKVYIGTRRGTMYVFTAGREKQLLHSVRLDAPINGTVTPANGVLYVPTMKSLYAFASGE